MPIIRAAAVQFSPVLYSREATVAKLCATLFELGREGVQFAVFPETVVPYYPYFSFVQPPFAMGKQHLKLLEQSVTVPSDVTRQIGEACREAGVVACIGVNERDGGTLYNAQLLFDADGSLIQHRRKITPTYHERMVWGQGDGVGLEVVETPVGRVGGLICWENYMPLARFALYAQGPDIWVAPNWDDGPSWVATMQHIAAEARCWVLGAGYAHRVSDIPPTFPHRDAVWPDPDAWLNPGDSVIVAPGGKIVAGPLHEQFGVVSVEIDLDRIGLAQRSLDVSGHYARPDIFRLRVNRRAFSPVEFTDHE